MTKNCSFITGYTFTPGSNQDSCVFQSQERGDSDRAVERLRQRSNLSTRAREKCGELLSMLLAKSWPKSTQGANTSGLDPVTVEFLLSWNSMAGYFRFFGICFESKSISIVSTLHADGCTARFFFFLHLTAIFSLIKVGRRQVAGYVISPQPVVELNEQ